MKITLIGGNGFIGSHIVDRLHAAGNHSLSVFGRSPNKFSSQYPNIEYIYGDFENIELLRKTLWETDMVIHLLSTTVPATANLDPTYDVRSNLIGTIKLLEEVGKQKIKRFIYVSSGGTVYGNPEYTPMDEGHPLRPIDSYGITKTAIEEFVEMYAKKYGFISTIIRPSNPYGERQSFKGIQGVISTFLYKILKGENVNVWGDGSTIRDYIYIDDVVDFFIEAVNNEFDGIYNLGYGKGYSVNNILKMLEISTGCTAKVDYQPSSISSVKEVVLDISHSSRTFGWFPKTSLKSGIEKHYNWMKGEIVKYE